MDGATSRRMLRTKRFSLFHSLSNLASLLSLESPASQKLETSFARAYTLEILFFCCHICHTTAPTLPKNEQKGCKTTAQSVPNLLSHGKDKKC